MSSMYATVTSKGQITLPVEARRALGLHKGQKVSIRIEGDSLIIDAPQDLVRVRERLQREAKKKGTWSKTPVAGDGWAQRAEEINGNG